MSSRCVPAGRVVRRQRGFFCLVWLGVLAWVLPSLGHASAPPAAALSTRELLALSPQAVSALPPAAATTARERLSRALSDQAAALPRPLLLPKDARLPPAVQLPLTPALQKVLALDLQRRAQKLEPVLVAVLLTEALKPLGAPELLAPADAPAAASAGLLLPAELTPAMAALLRRICERAAAQWPTLLGQSTVRLVAGVPFAAVLSQPERVIYVNPVVLTLLAPAAAQAKVPGNPERELAYRSLADCAQKLQAGCRSCDGGDAAQCAAVRGTLGTATCAEVAADLTKLSNLCAERALLVGSVAECVARLDPACSSGIHTSFCHDVIDACIASPTAEARRPDGGSSEEPAPPGLLCTDCGCAAACGDFGRQACRPFGESCSDKAAQSCTETCNDCNAECNKSCLSSCTQLQRDCNSSCRAASSSCNSCGQGCNSCSTECNRSCSDCNRNCNQCNSDCNQCNNDCNRCNSDCNQCNNDCNQCNSGCNDCSGSGCNDCSGSGCNDCSGSGSGCNDCSGSGCNGCSMAAGGGYPRFPLPPGPADPPPPLARMLVGARGAVSLSLPPLLFLWWRRRLRPAAQDKAEAAR